MSAAGPAAVTMRKQCSWCSCLIQAGHEPTTHGICEKCLAEQRAKLAAHREAEALKNELVLEQYLESKRVAQPEPELPHAPAGRAERLS